MRVPESNQVELAESVLDFINGDMIMDEEWFLSVPDLLDALASAGVKLTKDEAGDASTAYLYHLTETNEESK
jgi:hypothetical protein